MIIENEINSKEKKRLTALEKSTLVTMAGSNPISQGLYVDIITPDLWNTKEKNYFTFNNIKELNALISTSTNYTYTSGPDAQAKPIEYKIIENKNRTEIEIQYVSPWNNSTEKMYGLIEFLKNGKIKMEF